MGCNCKKKMVLEDRYGVKEEESTISKLSRFFLKCFLFLIFIGLAIIVTPILVFVVIYQLAFKKNAKIVIPKQIGKYMEQNGQKLQSTY